jgi:dihydroflavonol-4-reductase
VRRACAGVDAVLHAAAHVHIGWTQEDLHRAINIEGTRNIARGARAAGARLVYVSSINALGLGKLESPADEESALPGVVACPYVTSKREAERVLLDEVANGLEGMIVNPSLMFGPWDWKPSSGRMMLEVAKGALVGPRGAANFCDVRDVASGCIAAARIGKPGRNYVLGAYNSTYFDFWQRIARIVGARPPRVRVGPFIAYCGGIGGDLWARVSNREPAINSAMIGLSAQSHCFSSDRAKRELGYVVRPLDETLADAWAWFVQHGYVKPRLKSD